ncbi:response regulator transcription factor [Armatimonas sp.]|uniref:response regulator transcription factor n=1 Tax=Armatimonas sp. TaxID=1872638 RepID=UPI0037522E44
MARLLLIEDEELLGEMIVEGLEAARHELAWCRNGAEGFERACEGGWAVILLDLMLPGMDGWSVCRRLRDRRDTTPILMLTARDEVEEKVRGLELGADDYLTKPFAFPEFKARIAALLRRERLQRRRTIQVADLVIDTDLHEVTRAGKSVALTRREFELLEALAARAGHVVSKEALRALWGGDAEVGSNTIDVHMVALRRKLDSERPENARLFHTVYGLGYVLREPSGEAQP